MRREHVDEPRARQYAAIDAVTLLEARFVRAALQTVRQFGLLYVDLVQASELIGNSERCAKQQALFLLGLSSEESLAYAPPAMASV